jgi:cystathionine gamma-synthase
MGPMLRLETLAVHASAGIDPTTGAVTPPLHLSTTFEHGPQGEAIHGFSYIREKNPTQQHLEGAMAQLEGGIAALAFASGMGACAAVLQSIEPGAHVILSDDLYIDLRHLVRAYLPRWRIESTEVDLQDLEALKRAIRPNTALVWAETPSNPMMKIADIERLAEIAHASNAKLLIDSTFATPVLQRPLALGADIVLHSTTKYCGGHSDAQGGCVVLKDRDLFDRLFQARQLLGAVASPFNSWLILRGLRSLVCRMDRHSANALAVAASLEACPKVHRVHYPGLPSHPGHAIAARQMRAFGGMLSFEVKGGQREALSLAKHLKLFVNATSLGGPESLVEHRASSEGKLSRAPETLLRLSIGLEHPDDLIEDLMQALA